VDGLDATPAAGTDGRDGPSRSPAGGVGPVVPAAAFGVSRRPSGFGLWLLRWWCSVQLGSFLSVVFKKTFYLTLEKLLIPSLTL
jgi:hypothetical protein